MAQAQNAIAALTSRRNFLASSAAVIAALTVPAFAAPSVEAEIASLVSEFESYGYTVSAVMDHDKPCGVWVLFPEGPRVWNDEGYLAAWNKWNKYNNDHKPELVAYLIKTGRLS